MTEKIFGVDVSHWQGANIDWEKVKQHPLGFQFAISKLSENYYYVDDTYVINMNGAAAAGFKVGGYHFFRGRFDPIKQADLYLKHYIPGDFPPVFDFEDSEGLRYIGGREMVKRALKWLGRVEQETGRVPFMYSAAWFLDQLPADTRLLRYPLWVAHYRRDRALFDTPLLPKLWRANGIKQVMHQYSDRGKIDGIDTGSTDLNYTTREDLITLGVIKDDPAEIPGEGCDAEIAKLQEIIDRQGSMLDLYQAAIETYADHSRAAIDALLASFDEGGDSGLAS